MVAAACHSDLPFSAELLYEIWLVPIVLFTELDDIFHLDGRPVSEGCPQNWRARLVSTAFELLTSFGFDGAPVVGDHVFVLLA